MKTHRRTNLQRNFSLAILTCLLFYHLPVFNSAKGADADSSATSTGISRAKHAVGIEVPNERKKNEYAVAFAGLHHQLLGPIRTLLVKKTLEQTVAAPLGTDATKPKNKDDYRIPGRSPEEALKSFVVPEGFEMQLVAQEPQVMDPIVISYDENGWMYVAEYLKFPNHPLEGKSESGRIRLLKDADNDGKYEKSFVFADGIAWPTGICPWDGGIYVVAAPDLWYLKDTDGDGQADIKKKIFTGFGFNNEEGTANNLIWGLDNWIYGAGSNSGGTVRPADDPDARGISMRGRDFRFHPVTGKFETLSGSEQFGNTFDDWGNRFICSNSKPVVHLVLPSRYLARNPYLPVPAVKKNIWVSGDSIYRISPPEAWRVARSKYRLSKKPDMAKTYVADDVFSACSGSTIYRGSVYPKQYQGNMLMGEVQGNLVSRFLMRPNGVTFDAVRVDINKELVASRDNWFRPVNLCNAPDGTMHIVDMSREVIETPTSMTEEIIASIDLLSGHDRGRIFRLAPKGFRAPAQPDLRNSTTLELVQTLENRNGWWRDTASRLLFQRQDKQAVGPLKKLLRESNYDLAQLHAMYALQGLGRLSDDDLLFALSSNSDGLKEHAVKLSETRLQKNSKLIDAIVSLANSPNAKVRFQVAFSLGETDAPSAAEALASIAKRDAGDIWMRTAVLSSSLQLAAGMLDSLLADSEFAKTSAGKLILRQLALIVGGRNKKAEVVQLLKSLESSKDSSMQRMILLGLGDGLRRSRASLSQYADQSAAAARLVNAMIANAEKILSNESAKAKQKEQAIEVLAHGKFENVSDILIEMLDSRQAPSVQLAASRTLADFKNPEVSSILLDAWQGLSPSVRGEVIETLLGRGNEGISALLEAIENKEIAAGFISPVHKERLMKHRNPQIKSRARKLFSSNVPSSRKKVLDEYRSALSLKGDAARGKKIFEQNCMTCHKLGSSGHDVGPNLATIQNATPETLLIQIIDPNREVLANYTQYIVVLDSGRVVTGIITSESPTSITLKRAENVKETILRQNIDEITGTGKSLMPEGLEQKIDKQQMQDLITFLQELKK